MVVYHGDQVGSKAHFLKSTVEHDLPVLMHPTRAQQSPTISSACVHTCQSDCALDFQARCVICQDTLVPLAAAQWLAKALLDCKLVVSIGATHQMYIIKKLLARVCEELAAAVTSG